MPPRYARNPRWTIAHEPGRLLVSAGADALFAIDDVTETAAAEIVRSWSSADFTPSAYSLEARDIFEQLLTANVVVHAIERSSRHALALRYVGARAPQLEHELARQLPAGVALAADNEDEPVDLVVVVRTDGLLADVAAGAAAEPGAHVLLDVAYEHTISLGPLVFPGDTACLDCFASRVSAYWGDPAAPERPAIGCHPGLVAGLLAMTVEGVLARDDRTLINATVAYDFATHRVTRSAIYKLPLCPTCGSGSGSGSGEPGARGEGAFALPWAPAR